MPEHQMVKCFHGDIAYFEKVWEKKSLNIGKVSHYYLKMTLMHSFVLNGERCDDEAQLLGSEFPACRGMWCPVRG